MPFSGRWVIDGQLTTVTPLRIGNGDIVTHPDLTERDRKEKKTVKNIEISAVTTSEYDGVNRRPYIPGSSIKGALRHLANIANIKSLDDLFGSEDPKNPNAVGGKAEFRDSFALGEYDPIHHPPFWSDSRYTGIATSVTINRRTRTASEKRLFHQEFIPPGVTFAASVGGDFSEAEVQDLLFLFEVFNHSVPLLTLGARNGGGWGRMRWEISSIKRLLPSEVAAWIIAGGPGVGYASLRPIPQSELVSYKKRAEGLAKILSGDACVTLKMRLKFEGHFLVNDPDQTGTAEENRPAFAPLLNNEGKILLPASSIRGAVRSHAERILRTIGGERIACYLDGRGARPPCDDVYEVDELSRLCLACQIFGTPGWRSPVLFSDFVSELPASSQTFSQQEFVAIDRFTGGGSEGMKFTARAAYRPTLVGNIKVHLPSLALTGAAPWALGIFVLVLRDLFEGDIRLGFGAGKGYGAVLAEILQITLPDWEHCPDVFKESLSPEQWARLGMDSYSSDVVRDLLGTSLIELEERVKAVAEEEYNGRIS